MLPTDKHSKCNQCYHRKNMAVYVKKRIHVRLPLAVNQTRPLTRDAPTRAHGVLR